MDVLCINTEDLTLTVAANGVRVAYARASRKQENIATCTKYRWGGIAGDARLYKGDTNDLVSLVKDQPAPPVFFENKDYFFEFDLEDGVTDAYVHSRLRDVQDRFLLRRNGSVLSGVLNFGNELGHSELVVRYKRNGEQKTFFLGFEVFSTKLDQQADLKRIMADIEEEYPLLVLDVMQMTFSNFRSGGDSHSDLVWWQVFAGIYKDFIKAARFILNKPHSRLVKQEQWVRADHLKHLSPRLEEELQEWRIRPERRYHTTRRTLSRDTVENRFLKHAIQHVAIRYARIRNVIEDRYGNMLTDDYHAELGAIEKQLITLRNHPLFRAVGAFEGLKQESLVLQRATGYSAVYKNYIMLRRGFSLLEGFQRLETKSIADLYQIWCFLEMKNIVTGVLGKRPDQVELGLIKEQGLVLQLAQGAGSRLGYDLKNGEVLELYHEFNISRKFDLVTFTGPQRPDIALRIKRNDLSEGYMLTYLFDAKYRLAYDDKEGAPDAPPPDALNQMHRYRDAIYYSERREGARPEKEVIGGYILFPGEGTPDEVQVQGYFKAIDQVNIGAFPLRPGDEKQRTLLRNHIVRIIENPTSQILSDVLPQKQMNYQSVDPIVLVGVVGSPEQGKYLAGKHPRIYHTGEKHPSGFGDDRMLYFAPYYGGQGIPSYFRIVNYEIKPRNKIYPRRHPLFREDNSLRVVIHLGERVDIRDGEQYRQVTNWRPGPYQHTTLSRIRKGMNSGDDIELVGRDELGIVR